MQSSLTTKIDLIKQQKELFGRIFSKKDNTWKIIIFDQSNHDIISSLFKMKDFRENNITLYFNIKQQRQQLHGITAIYLIKPINQNVQIIIKDFQKDLYSSVLIHFTSQPPTHFLSNFAKNLSKRKSSAISRIIKVQYSNVGFQCIDRQMCILPENNEIINFLATLKHQPIFIYGASEQQQVYYLKQRINDSNFFNKSNQQAQSTQLRGPKKYTKVLMFNREADLFPVIGHGITYAGFMQDIWRFNTLSNRIVEKDFTVNLNDQIWLQRKNMLIHQMQLQKQCNKITSKMMNMNSKMDEFSELSQKKKKVQWHLDTASQMIRQAKKRRLNQFHAVQEDLYIKRMLSGQNKNSLVELLKTDCQFEDKVRLMLVYMVCAENYDQNQVQELQTIFPEIKKNNFYSQLKAKKSKTQSAQQNPNSKYFKKLAKGLWKNLVNQQKKYLLIKYLQKTKDLTQKSLNDLGLKVSTLKQVSNNVLPHINQIENTVVYCVGGVCFNEYGNLAEYDPSVIYTGDRLANYREYL